MEEFLQQQSGSRPNLAAQSFSSLLTTQQPSPFLTLLSSPITTRGHLKKKHTDQNPHFYDPGMQYNDYDGDYTEDGNVLYFEYDDDQPTSGDQSLTSKLTDRQGEAILSFVESQLFLDENLSPGAADGSGDVPAGAGGSGVSEPAFLIQKTRPQIVITFATGVTCI